MPARFEDKGRLPLVQHDPHPLADFKDWIVALLVYGFGIPRPDIRVTMTHTEDYSRCGLNFMLMQSMVSIDVIEDVDVKETQLSGRVFIGDHFELIDTWLSPPENVYDFDAMLPWFNEIITRFREMYPDVP